MGIQCSASKAHGPFASTTHNGCNQGRFRVRNGHVASYGSYFYENQRFMALQLSPSRTPEKTKLADKHAPSTLPGSPGSGRPAFSGRLADRVLEPRMPCGPVAPHVKPFVGSKYLGMEMGHMGRQSAISWATRIKDTPTFLTNLEGVCG